jgi:uncharacterized membrane protein YkvA (DUF1232 family)
MIISFLRAKQTVLTYLIALFDYRTSPVARLSLVALAIYVLSPFDIIPDFIPLFGLLDELIIAPLVISFSKRFIDAHVLQEAECKAKAYSGILNWILFALVFLILLWLGLMIWLVVVTIRYLT